ncbi:MAG TPA: hypothetical protein VJY63_06595 [Marinospirillum sp.]|uniref:hypothetical protein n=1 Tax=Marinospirillum sp. TaxID=2183934 RepID=UPI002B464580|nr:hypothetical protein [Marinospirillum sp.]HKM15573.1 hypothetical protein [Marinospirillum sp.]
MVDMAKLKEDALQRKRQHEEKELKKQVSGSKKPARRTSASGSRGSKTRGSARNSAQGNMVAQPKGKKNKRSVSRWVLDILLVLGALIVVMLMFNPF